MKIVVQNFKSGLLYVGDVPPPRCGAGAVLVRTHASLISAGTDRAIIGLGKKGYLGKALDRPDLARKVINRARTEGLWPTYQVVKNLIAEPIPLGYSAVGTVIAVGRDVTDIAVGDRVACAGLGHANHAEIIQVPRNLAARVPESVCDEQAAYATLGAIAIHGVRQAEQQFGATVLIVGLGLVGQIAVQLSNAAGYRVIGLDIDPKKIELATRHGALLATTPDDPGLKAKIADVSGGQGADAVLLTVGSRDSGEVFKQAAALARDRARIVVVGDVKMEIDRRAYFEKELEIVQSRSYGPGRYDQKYELKGHDYPLGYVRWTEGRNLRCFLEMIADRRIDPSVLTTHRFPISQAADAYDIVTGKVHAFSIGILLEYDRGSQIDTTVAAPAVKRHVSGTIGLGIIGTGTFCKGILLPALKSTGAFHPVGIASSRGISARAVADRYGAAYATADADAVIKDPAVDAVVIATRHDSHARYVILALEQGKHVFVEKPLCIQAEDLEAIEVAARRSTGTLTVGYNRRHSPLVGQMIEHFAGRREPLSMLYRVNAGRIPLTSELAWVHDPDIGGGRIVGEGCHFIDTFQALCGRRPTSVQAAAAVHRASDLVNNDVVSFTIGFQDGSIGTVHYFANGDASYPKERIEVFGQERIAVLENFRTLDLVAGNKTKRRRTMSAEKGFAQEAAAFAKACRSGTPSVTLESLLDTSRATFAVQYALYDGGSSESDVAQSSEGPE